MSNFIAPLKPVAPLGLAEHAQPGPGNFAAVFSQAMQELEASQAQSQQDGEALALGQLDNLGQLQINAMKAETMLNTAVQLTSRAVGAYKEIMQTQL